MRKTPIFLKGLRKNCLFLRGWDCDDAFDLFLFLGGQLTSSLWGWGVAIKWKGPCQSGANSGLKLRALTLLRGFPI